jgi:hypothetical protein
MKKALFALLVLALILAVAVPVMAGPGGVPGKPDKPDKPPKEPWVPPADWNDTAFPWPTDPYDGIDSDYDNIGCSAAAFEKWGGVTFEEDLSGFNLEIAVAKENFAFWGDQLDDIGEVSCDDIGLDSPLSIQKVVCYADGGNDKDFVEYVKLWNKGWGEWVDDDKNPDTPDVWVVHKTCPKKNDWP